MARPTGRSTVVSVLVAACVATFAAGTALGWRFVATDREQTATTRAAADAQIGRSAASLDSALRRLQPRVALLARGLEGGRLGAADAGQAAARLLAASPAVSGVGVAYAPGAGPGGAPRWGRWFVRRRGAPPAAVDIAALYDYTAFEREWYVGAILDGPRWSEPFVLDPAEGPQVAYTVPFRAPGAGPGADPAGVVMATISLRELGARFRALSLGKSGYGFLVSHEGRFLSHPRQDLVDEGRTLFETAWARNDTGLHAVGVRAIRGERGVASHRDELTGQESWIIHVPVRSARWALAGVVFHEEVSRDDDRRRRALLAVIVLLLLAVATGTVAGVAARPRSEATLWGESLFLTFLLAAGIGCVWRVADLYPVRTGGDHVPILDAASLERFFQTREPGAEAEPEPAYVPTGLFLRSVEFVSANNVHVTGYVWQRYRPGEHDGVERGFVMPEAVEAAAVEVDRKRSGGEEWIRWDFSATLRQDFYYDRYPLDREEVWVRLQPRQVDRPVVLVPDLEAYTVTNPAARPGVEKRLILPGWTVEGSYFAYRAHEYNTSFGVRGAREARRAELSYHLEIRRNFLGPFTTSVVPLAVAAAMLFAILLTGRRGAGASLSGFTALDAVLGCAALLFAIIFAHVALRDGLNPERVMYFEYFYFATYLAMLAVAINAIFLSSDDEIRWLHARENLAAKLAFWPLYLGILLVLTVVAFY